MLSMKAKYALKALIHMAQTDSPTLPSKQIADAENIPQKFLDNILQELRRRAGERGRPPQELDYIDRLLKEF